MGVHLFLSPHLDDAILSCGGVIHRLGRNGERTIIVTAMAGDPQDAPIDSPVLQAIRAQWDEAVNPIATRRAEDAQAAHELNAQIYHLALTECAFRATLCGVGEWIALYPQYDSPFQAINEADDARLVLLETHLPFDGITRIYAPLCVDDHVDHRLVRDWALVLTGSLDAPQLVFYEEFPQARTKGSLQRAQDFYRKQMPALVMEREIALLDEDDLAAKLRAMRCYRSHLNVLWNDLAEMDTITRELMQSIGNGAPAERYWRVLR
ncbi:MAG: PIG-L family deacetylase [Chloroflexota bacterium]